MSCIKPVKLAYNSFEPVNGVKETSPILFLHGITASKEYWHDMPQTVANATNRKVYTLDARNHGDSEWSDEFDFDINVIDLEHFMNGIKADKVILVGHSMGGVTVMKTTLRWPNRIEKLIVEDMTVRKTPQQFLDLIILFMNLAQQALKMVPPNTPIETAVKLINAEVLNLLPETIKPLVRTSNEYRIVLKPNDDGSYSFKTNLKVLLEKLKDVNTLCKEEKECSYQGPACFICGEQSPMQVLKDEELIKGFFPNAKFVTVEEASHGIHIDRPVEFTEKLLQCLKE